MLGDAGLQTQNGGKLDHHKNTNNKSIVLNTHNFTVEEVNIMANQISSKFNLDTYVKLNKKKNIIVIKSNSFGDFIKLTHNYIIPEMRYKLPE
jgi:LAGLIDADG DNA endonuclease family